MKYSNDTLLDEWAGMIDCNIGEDKLRELIVFLSEVYCDNEQRLTIIRALLEFNEQPPENCL